VLGVGIEQFAVPGMHLLTYLLRLGLRVPKPGCRRPRLAIWLALILPLLRLTRASAADDNYIGYRREFYREDNDRISVDTDSYSFDVGISSKVRISGNAVFDAISGATPTGAPPQTKWPFPMFAQYYANAYSQAYTAQYNQFIAQNQIYVDAGYITYQQLTNTAAQTAAANAPGIATNSATASFRSLTNSPNYRNNSVPVTHIHDYRSAFSLGVPIALKNHLITPSFSYSTESDYRSFGGALNYGLALNNKNTTLNLGYSHNSDSVRDDRFIWEDKLTDDILIGLVQLMSPKSYLTLNFSCGYERGYLSDPYRGVMFAAKTFDQLQLNPHDAALTAEKRPRHRSKEIAYISWTQFVDPLEGSLEAGYRFFHDSYNVFANTVELTWNQRIGHYVVLSPAFRYYYQTAASFYFSGLVPNAANPPDSYSSDYRLSEFNSFAGGLKVTWRFYKHASLDAGYLRYAMLGLDGKTSKSAYPSANIFTIGARLWF
jgi:hypothetical protein